VSFWIMKSIVQKLAVAALLALLAFAVWTQRVSLQDCADKVQDSFELRVPTSPWPTPSARSSGSP
jgi:hypothetical protein